MTKRRVAHKAVWRQPSRLLDYPWPFPLSVVEGRGLVKNVVKITPTKKVRKRA